jgi:hypothetical protein
MLTSLCAQDMLLQLQRRISQGKGSAWWYLHDEEATTISEDSAGGTTAGTADGGAERPPPLLVKLCETAEYAHPKSAPLLSILGAEAAGSAAGEAVAKTKLLELGMREASILQAKLLQVLVMAQHAFALGAHRTGQKQVIQYAICNILFLTHTRYYRHTTYRLARSNHRERR